MMKMNGVWKWICEVERRRRGHCIGLLEGHNSSDSLRECLIELNLVFDISFVSSSSCSTCIYFSIQICTYYQNDSIEFVRLEELKEPSAVRGMEEEVGLSW